MTPVDKMRTVMTAIASAPATTSFADIIAEERDAFKGLHVIYATHAHESYIQQVRIDRIEAECSLLCGLFDGSGLLFYSDRIYAHMQQGPANIVIDFSIGLDKNLCDNIRRYVAGRGIDRPADLHRLLRLVRGPQGTQFNYDFFAYLVEEYEHFYVPGNDRPGETVFALKALDYLDEEAIARFPASPLTPEIERAAWTAAQQSLHSLFANDSLAEFQLDQRAIYAVLLKALLLKWRGSSISEALGILSSFSLQVLGKLAKREIYFAWKMIGGDGKSYPFFQPALKRVEGSMDKLKSMSWDLTMLRWAETMCAMQRPLDASKVDFFIPFLASNDRKFHDMVVACPLKAIVLDREHKILNTVFRDELVYQLALQDAMKSARIDLGSAQDQARRLGAPLSKRRIEEAICELEGEAGRLVCSLQQPVNR